MNYGCVLISSIVKVLAFFAHPDDETMLSGGALALLAQSEVEVHYLIATRGEGGERGDPPLCLPEELGSLREKEVACAVENLGGSSLTNLGYPDPVVGPDQALYPFTTDLARLAAQVAEQIQRRDVDILISHGTNGEYGHPAHLLCNKASRLVAASSQDSLFFLYTVAAAYPEHPKPRILNRSDPAHIVINVRSVLNNKIQAALCHKTQHALFIRRASIEAGRRVKVPEVILKEESLHRVYPAKRGERGGPLEEFFSAWAIQQPF
jgi:LmbE family N-acetylglucosaminyl deacetylase